MPVLWRGAFERQVPLDAAAGHGDAQPAPKLAQERGCWGYRMLNVLLDREGYEVNHKCVYRLFREEGLQVRRRRRRKRAVQPRRTLETPTTPIQRWSMDFVHDELTGGRQLHCLTVVDDISREAVAIHLAHSIPGEHMAQVLDRTGRARGLPAAIVCDNGPEFTGRHLDRGCTNAESISSSSGQANRSKTLSPRASTGPSGRNAATSTGL